MNGIITLKGLRFQAFHGVYEEEKQNGNTFLVDIKIKTNISKPAISDNIEDALDYAKVYAIVEEEMKIPSNLMEHLALRMANKIIRYAKNTSSVTVSIKKLNPPINQAHADHAGVRVKIKN